ncbi:MAG: DEAD/DEAH box helicase [Deltaproteobacteria bacterium]|nr:DEAD/DEAH box helicase [Deltaproteobacteria bacterium]
MDAFGPATRAWFDATFVAPTPVQTQGWQRIAAGEHVLLIAPTGSGKTLAAFLWSIDALSRLPPDAPPGVRVLYVSPLKALVYDIERNLRAPLAGIERAARQGHAELRLPRVGVRTGDTTTKERRDLVRHPAEILVTTPESLYLLLGSAARETLRTVETVIVDEIHALAPTKRGAHLALSLERLSRLTEREPQRIGLSATVRPPELVARFLGGDRPVAVVDASARPALDLRIEVPVPDMTRPSDGVELPEELGAERGGPITEAERRTSVWPAIQPRLLELISAHRTTIVFVNSRGLCERLAQRLNELAGEDLVGAHHGSISHSQRKNVEEALKAGTIRAIVATSSLELGIDMGAVDLVLLVESPGSVASGLQRIGRAGHGVGQVSKGRVFPKHRGDLLEATVVAGRMVEGAIEALRLPRNPLDVLSQHVVAMAALEPLPVADLEAMVHRAASFRDLTHELLAGVLDMLAGRYPSTDFADLRPRIVWDRDTDTLSGRKGSKALAAISGGTIPDRGLFGVHLGPEGPRVGELDEEMVHESLPGQTFMLGASTWRIEEITRDRVIVSPAPGQPGRLPFWHGEGPGRPVELGRAVGAFVRELGAMDEAAAEEHLQSDWRLDPLAARNLVRYLEEQREATGTLPTDRAITIERFRDELGDLRVCILSPFGARVHAPWALALEARLSVSAGFDVQTLWTDDGIVLRFVEAEEGLDERGPDLDLLLPDADQVEALVVEQLGNSSLFAAQFRENASRALLLPRRHPGSRTPLWAQRLKSQRLLAVARAFPAFPIVLETYRACLQDVMDLPALVELLRAIARREVRVEQVETTSASPFSRSLVFAFVASTLYEGDAPLAERRAHALTLDRHMLRELLGHEELRELLDASVLDALEAELQLLADGYRARHADGLHDVLRRLGDLDVAELVARSDGDAEAWLAELVTARRAVGLRVGAEARFIAVEDTGLYRDALGCQPPPGVPLAFLDPVDAALPALLQRYARTHGPFVARDVARRYALRPAAVEAVLVALEASGQLMRGELRPGGTEREWCDPEVLRRARQRTLARLRREVAPVEAAVLARFLPAWHGICDDARGGPERLLAAIAQLEGLPLSFRDLEQVMLPARVRDFQPRMLDELGALGQLVWVGHGALGPKDGRVALYRRERLGLLLDAPAPWEAPSPLHATLMAHLETRGACFFQELHLAASREQGETREQDVLEALWDLVWAGLLTNDTFQPLRALGGRGTASARRPGPRRAALAGGRWSLVRDQLGVAPGATERAHTRAVALLERHGVVTREVAASEPLVGGFASIYRVFRAMEEAGRIRRGYFVEGLGGAQFAWPGAVDRLRSARMEHEAGTEAERGLLLAATDPACPFGVTVAWPQTVAEGGRPRRAAGARVVLVAGEPVAFLERGHKALTTFAALAAPGRLDLLVEALRAAARHRRGRALRLETIDGQPARQAPLAEAFRASGFSADHKGLTLEPRG